MMRRGCIEKLYNIFRIAALSPFQAAILNVAQATYLYNKLRDAVEFHRHQQRRPPNAYDVSDPVPAKLADGSVIHLHGSIRVITPENIGTSIVLTESSYVNQYVTESTWY